MKVDFDIDIDVADRDQLLTLMNYTPASIQVGSTFKKHNTGVYFQNVPVDPKTGYCGIDYKQAGDVGFFKIDFLNNHVYTAIRDEAHLVELINKEPMWDLLEYKEVVSTLFQIHNHYHLVQQYKPQSIEELAMLLAIIRPGKSHLQGKSWEEISKTVWQKDDDQYYFKRSHSIAYSMVIVIQLNLLQEEVSLFS